MDPVAVPLNADAETQIINLSIAPNGNAVSLRLEIRWLDNAARENEGLSGAELFLRSSGEAVLSHILYITGRVPEQAYLLGQFGHLRIGSAALVPISSDTPSADPGRDDLADFELLWGDCIAYNE